MAKQLRQLIRTANGKLYNFCDVLPFCDAELMCLGLAAAFETARREGQKGEREVCQEAFQKAYDVRCHLYALNHHEPFFFDDERDF